MESEKSSIPIERFFDDKWKISGSNLRPKARWSRTTEELVKMMVSAFGDFEVKELKTEELIRKAKVENGKFIMEWDFQNGSFEGESKEIKDEELNGYISNRLDHWAEMAMGFIETKEMIS